MAHLSAALLAASSKSSGSILDPIAKPIAALLAYIYAVVPNYGVAIMVLSVVWMIIISPLTLKSTRSMLAMQKLQPQLKKLQEQHKDDRQAFAQAQMDLFREHNVSPFGSCLPMLLPLPVFFALFRVIDGLSHSSNGVTSPKYLSHSTQMYKDIVSAHGHLNAFGMDLSKSPFSHHASVWAAAPYWLVLLIMAGTGVFQSAQMMNRNPAAAQANPQMKLMKWLPLGFAVICARFPAGVIVYYAMSNICRIVQQDAMYRFDPKVKALVAKEVVEVEEKTHEIEERDRQMRNRPGYTPPRSLRDPKPAATGKGDAGRNGAKGAKSPAAANGGSGPGGRMRFRDLLAAAAEQQKAQQGSSAGGGAKNGGIRNAGGNGGGSGGRSGGGGGGGNGSGNASTGGRNGAQGNRSGSNGNGAARNGSGASRNASRKKRGR